MTAAKKCYLVCAVVFLVAFVVGPWTASFLCQAAPGFLRLTIFCGALLGLALFLVGLGLEITRSPLGILQSGRNTYSLSRMQMVLWTWLILSALIAVAIARAWRVGNVGTISTALQIDIPGDLLAVMGISYFTGFAAPAALALKSQPDTTATTAQINLASNRLNERIYATGNVIHRPASAQAKLADIVRGDEVANAGIIDLAKVQQLLITLLLVVLYLAILCGLFYYGPFTQKDATHEFTQLPDFSKDFVSLLTLSHAGYLGSKLTPKPAGGSSAVNVPTRRPLPPEGGAP